MAAPNVYSKGIYDSTNYDHLDVSDLGKSCGPYARPSRRFHLPGPPHAVTLFKFPFWSRMFRPGQASRRQTPFTFFPQPYCGVDPWVKDYITPLAFISFCNDAIRRDVVISEMGGTKSKWKKIVSLIPHNKQYKALPAVKIARLSVQQNVKSRGLGTQLLNMTKQLFLTDNRTGCRFLTVDSYITEQAIHFYEKNYFKFFTQSEKERCLKKLKSDILLPRLNLKLLRCTMTWEGR